MKSGLMRNALSQVWGRLVSNIGVRLLKLPLMLTALGAEEYGRWLVLASVSSWLVVPASGPAPVAAGSMAMAASRGDLREARRGYSDLMVLYLGSSIALAAIAVAACLLLPLHAWLGLSVVRTGEIRSALVLLCIGLLVSGMGDVFGARLRAAGRAHVQMVWLGGREWTELLMLLVVLRHTGRFDHIAAGILAVGAAYVAGMYLSSLRPLREVVFDPASVTWQGLGRLLRKSLYYQALPLGHALLLHGQVLVVQGFLGPAAVAVYSTARTLIRVVSQSLELINHSVWPEMSLLFGRSDLTRIASLHRVSVAASVGLSLAASFVLWLIGPHLYALYTGRLLVADRALLTCFLLSLPLNAMWYTSSMVQLACNRYEELAVRFLFSAVVSLAACAGLAWTMGLMGAALASAVSDLIMIPFVFRRSLALAGDSIEGFWGRVGRDVAEWKTVFRE